jgi:hypothetical protein
VTSVTGLLVVSRRVSRCAAGEPVNRQQFGFDKGYNGAWSSRRRRLGASAAHGAGPGARAGPVPRQLPRGVAHWWSARSCMAGMRLGLLSWCGLSMRRSGSGGGAIRMRRIPGFGNRGSAAMLPRYTVGRRRFMCAMRLLDTSTVLDRCRIPAGLRWFAGGNHARGRPVWSSGPYAHLLHGFDVSHGINLPRPTLSISE